MRWSLGQDFRTEPDQANPQPDRYENPGVWSFAQGPAGRDPRTYELLPTFSEHFCGVEGLATWHGPLELLPDAFLPFLGTNTTGSDQGPCDAVFDWPAEILAVHPLPARAVAVTWTSPIAGSVTVTADINDLDVALGDGVHWALVIDGAVLADGSFDEGGHDRVRTPVALLVGTSVSLVVDAGADHDFNNDTTGLTLTLVTPPGPGLLSTPAG
jgi:hypothetical protein